MPLWKRNSASAEREPFTTPSATSGRFRLRRLYFEPTNWHRTAFHELSHFLEAIGVRSGSETRRSGWEFVRVCIDDASRIAFVQPMPNQRKESAVAFLEAAVAYYASLGLTIERVMRSSPKSRAESGHSLLPYRRLQHGPVDDGRGSRPCFTSSTARMSAAPLPAKHWSVQHSACGARITLSSFRIGSSRVGRLLFQHVEPGAGDAAFLPDLGQRLLIDDRAARRIDQIGGRLHQREAFGIDEMMGLGRERTTHADDVGAAKHLLQADELDAEFGGELMIRKGIVTRSISYRTA